MQEREELPSGRGDGRLRAAAVLLGVAAIGFGVWNLVVVAPSATRPIAAAGWLIGVLGVHDALLAPVALVVGAVLVRLLPGAVRRIVGVGVFVAVCLVVIALPPLLGPGVAGNPSATPRDYARGLVVALGIDLVAVLVAVGVAVRVAGATRVRPGSTPRTAGRRRPTAH